MYRRRSVEENVKVGEEGKRHIYMWKWKEIKAKRKRMIVILHCALHEYCMYTHLVS